MGIWIVGGLNTPFSGDGKRGKGEKEVGLVVDFRGALLEAEEGGWEVGEKLVASIS